MWYPLSSHMYGAHNLNIKRTFECKTNFISLTCVTLFSIIGQVTLAVETILRAKF